MTTTSSRTTSGVSKECSSSAMSASSQDGEKRELRGQGRERGERAGFAVQRRERLALAGVLVEQPVGPFGPERQIVPKQRQQHLLLEGQVDLEGGADVADRRSDGVGGGGPAVERGLGNGAGPVEQRAQVLVLRQDALAGSPGVEALGGRGPAEVERRPDPCCSPSNSS